MKVPIQCYVLECGYCDKDKWPEVKREQINKYKIKYPDVKCVLVRSDTPGLRTYMTCTFMKKPFDYDD